MKNLKAQIFLKFGFAPLVFGLVLGLPAGSFGFWEAWVYMGLLLIPVLLVVLYFMKKDPALLERRMRMKEKERDQSLIVSISSLFILAGFILPGFDFRFGWSEIPVYLVLLADAFVLLGYLLFFVVMKENSFLSRTVEVVEGQKVINTGPYSIVRHPMYTGVLLMYTSTPIALGSWWAMIPFITLPVFLVLRILNEEKVLVRDLPGYEEYRRTVRYRLIPHIW
jgi:protein-S-isoprenylcysteine O-methyltransferase Ste14